VKEEDKPEYWDRKWKLREQRLREKVLLDGSDGEREFAHEIFNRARGKKVLDLGCGPGDFSLRVSRIAKSVTGIDTSKVALEIAKHNLARSQLENVTFTYGNARKLPFSAKSFDLVYSRRGPASDTKRNLTEVLRVLRRGGAFMEIIIGERDKRNVAEIFGRGQKLGFRGQVSTVKKRWLEEVGFKSSVARDYLGTEVFRSLDDLIIRLKTAPIVPKFDVETDRTFLEAVRAECMTERGIETPVHRVVLMAKK
jgi:ubiquinone/menaquinone biosynthesis C-methylase UbiE